MAEIGVIAAVLQFTGTIAKLKTAWDDIRNVPQELSDLFERVILKAEQLEYLESLHSQFSISPSDADNKRWRRSQLLLQRCLKSLEGLLNNLHQVSKSHRMVGRLRLYLRKDDLQKCAKRLHDAEKDLQLAHSELASLQLLHISRKLKSQQVTKLTSHKSVKSKKSREPTKRGNGMKREDSLISEFDFKLPLWTFSKCVQLLINRSHRSIGISIRTYNMLPNDSKVFQSADKGQWNVVRRMFNQGTASPFDVDEWGTTLLHIAAKQANPAACQLLLESGLNPSTQTWYGGKSSMEEFALAYRPTARLARNTSQRFHKSYHQMGSHLAEPAEQSAVATARMLLKFDESQEGNSLWSTRSTFSLPSAALKLLANDLVENYETIDRLLRVRIALSTSSFDPNTFAVLLGNDLSPHEAFKLVSNSKTTYGHRQLLFNITNSLARQGFQDDRRKGWMDILASLIMFESQGSYTTLFRSLYVHFIVFHLSSPNSRHLRHSRTLNEVFTCIGRIWLQILVDLGVDLNRYAKAENACMKYPETITWSTRKGLHHCSRIKFLLTGSKIDDWKVFVEPAIHVYRQATRPGVTVPVIKGTLEDEMAGEFWYMIENPEVYSVPGTYLVEEKLTRNQAKPVKVKGPIF